MRKKLLPALIFIIICTLCGCENKKQDCQVVATTLPVYEFTVALCDGTDIGVTRLITESVSCLHDYTLQVSQMRAIESAQIVILSGSGLEDFLDATLLQNKNVIDASQDVPIIHSAEAHHEHAHEHHQEDSHIWLSLTNAAKMAENICVGLSNAYPEYANIFSENSQKLQGELQALSDYAERELKNLSCREIITFHDGFAYLAETFGLTILQAIEEDAGSEASAAELIELTKIVTTHNLPAIFTECNGSTSAANIISAETGAKIFALDMAMSDRNYFDAMKYNIDTLKEALE